ncbi:lipoprotein BA_5634 family protein [Bacillus bombysepticus]|uniref:lipoprotein BA_5634 family protein n=1 Tax=Bacillus bombysepticus TaxID=658666 RepID=UPI0030166A86
MKSKKIIGLGMAALFSVSVLSGCSALDGLLDKANTVVVYGDKAQVNKASDTYKDEVKNTDKYGVKMIDFNSKKIMVINDVVAGKMVEKGLLKKVDAKDDVTPLKEIPKSDTGIIFAKNKDDELVLKGQKLKYSGNVVIGDGRVYADMFAIVNDEVYKELQGAEKSVGVLEFSKDPDEKILPLSKEVEKAQLVKLEK